MKKFAITQIGMGLIGIIGLGLHSYGELSEMDRESDPFAYDSKLYVTLAATLAGTVVSLLGIGYMMNNFPDEPQLNASSQARFYAENKLPDQPARGGNRRRDNRPN